MTASPRRIAAIVLRQAYLIRSSFARFLPLFMWVAIDMLLWGFLSRYLDALTGAGMRFVAELLGAVLLWDFLVRVAQGVTIAFLEDVWSRNFLNFFATPLSVAEYLGGLVLTSVASSSVGLVVMLALATTVFGLPFLSIGAMALPSAFILFLCGIALGIFGAALVLRLGPASEWFVWIIPAAVSPFASVFYPVASLPGWMQAVARLVPPSYVFESLRAGIAGGASAGGASAAGALPGAGAGVPAAGAAISGTAAWALGCALTLAYAALSCWFFLRTYRHAIRTGLIARYSAESVA